MKSVNLRNMLSILVACALIWGCVTPEPKKTEPAPSAVVVDQAPKTLAILPFENNSVTDPERFAPLGKGLSAMLITDLKQAGTSLKLIERTAITSLLKEIALSQSGSVDQNTAIEAGKILGAQSIAFGSFMVLGSSVRIDTRIVKVETSELIMAESVDGSSNDFISLERGLANKIASSLKVALKPIAKSQSSIEAALLFSQGLEALDAGNKAEARKLFQKCIDLDPTYTSQIDDVGGLD